MRKLLVLLVVLSATACARPAPTTPPDPAYHFTPGDRFELMFSERLTHEPHESPEKPFSRATVARFDVHVVAVRPDGAAHLRLIPTFGQVSYEAHGRPPLRYELWANRPRDPDDHSEGARYLAGVAQSGLHVVIDREGRWLRDFRGPEPPDRFPVRDEWAELDNLTTYPSRHIPEHLPLWLATYVPADWRRRPGWIWESNLAVFPPTTGYIPLQTSVKIVGREGSLISLAGDSRQIGAARTKPALGIVMQGDRTDELKYAEGSFEARFDLDWGMPMESRVERTWRSVRTVAGLGIVTSDERQILVFKMTRRMD